jgi:hypothetical protein
MMQTGEHSKSFSFVLGTYNPTKDIPVLCTQPRATQS